jgi:hypothetical protein
MSRRGDDAGEELRRARRALAEFLRRDLLALLIAQLEPTPSRPRRRRARARRAVATSVPPGHRS